MRQPSLRSPVVAPERVYQWDNWCACMTLRKRHAARDWLIRDCLPERVDRWALSRSIVLATLGQWTSSRMAVAQEAWRRTLNKDRVGWRRTGRRATSQRTILQLHRIAHSVNLNACATRATTVSVRIQLERAFRRRRLNSRFRQTGAWLNLYRGWWFCPCRRRHGMLARYRRISGALVYILCLAMSMPNHRVKYHNTSQVQSQYPPDARGCRCRLHFSGLTCHLSLHDAIKPRELFHTQPQ